MDQRDGRAIAQKSPKGLRQVSSAHDVLVFGFEFGASDFEARYSEFFEFGDGHRGGSRAFLEQEVQSVNKNDKLDQLHLLGLRSILRKERSLPLGPQWTTRSRRANRIAGEDGKVA